MDYVFGTEGAAEVLRTKGDAHTDLTGFHQLEREYPDQTILDNFHIVRKMGSKEDAEGNCYDWYEIDRHYRSVDRSGPVAEKAAASIAALEDALCQSDEETDGRLTAVEDALCDLDAAISGTES